MFREFLRFELRYQLRSPLPWLIALLFALLAFGAMTTDDDRRSAAPSATSIATRRA